jgi:hypothetical protein
MGKGRCRAEEAESNGTMRVDLDDDARGLDAERSSAGIAPGVFLGD